MEIDLNIIINKLYLIHLEIIQLKNLNKLFLYILNLILYNYYFNSILNGDWGLGIGDWGLGIGDWAQSPIPNPQSPIPNPQSPILIFYDH